MEVEEIAENAFANDVVIYARDITDLQITLNIWDAIFKKKNMKINVDKTEVMPIGKTVKKTR